jgi:hypothetical protein
MFRNLACAGLVLAMTFAFVSAEEFKGKLLKVDGDKLNVTDAEKGEAKTFDVVKDVKVYKVEKKTKSDVAGGLTAPELANIGKKGLFVRLNVNGDNKVTEITITNKKYK